MDYDPRNPLLTHDIQPFRRFFNVESQFMAAEGYSQNAHSIRLRNHALHTIEKHSKCENFDAFIPYLAMNYFDRFISRHEVLRVHWELLPICCLTLAWKMRINSFSVTRFLTDRGLNTDRRDILRTEFEILNGLQWRMRSLTPICFVDYFLSLVTPSTPALSRRNVNKIIVRVHADIKLTRFKPSTVAAASIIFAASSKLFPPEFSKLKQAILSCQFVQKEEVERCMDAMGSENTGLKVSVDSQETRTQATKNASSERGIGETEILMEPLLGRGERESEMGEASIMQQQGREAGGCSEITEEAAEEEGEESIIMNFELNWKVSETAPVDEAPAPGNALDRCLPRRNCCFN
ncbi:putative cyclin-D6-1 [Malania oleifera]|uniref:putative cyclin-D6-1 n=1 Tax=Malania oleifera TaxID=397392 RepID=UPI0025AE65B9|nr:putative cyclin-D6-1 [Malania oleifera]